MDLEIIENFERVMQYWAVGSSFNSTNDHSEDFIKNNYWRDGYGLSGNNRYESTLEQLQKGDILVMKSSSTKGKNHTTPFTKIKAIGRITGKVNYYTFLIKWFDTKIFPKDFDNVWYSKTVEALREDDLLEFAKDFIKKIL